MATAKAGTATTPAFEEAITTKPSAPVWHRLRNAGREEAIVGATVRRPMSLVTPRNTVIEPTRRPLTMFGMRLALALLIAGLLLSACDGGPSTSDVSKKLASKVLVAPFGYRLDPTPGAVGQITPALFAQYGGDASSRAAFAGGFKANYVHEATGEGISVTILQFRSAASASRYLAETAPQTLSYAGATHAAYAPIPGAVAVDGTRAYAGEYAHGVLMVRGVFYAQLVYVNVLDVPAPIELKSWAVAQYDRLSPN